MRAHLNRSPVPPLLTLLGLSGLSLWRMDWPILILIVPFLVAYVLWLAFGWRRPAEMTPRLQTLLILLIAAQIAHFTEEYLTRFQSGFPALWGNFWHGDPTVYSAWDTDFFIFGNLLMDVLWLVALVLLHSRNAWANYMIWLFLAGMITNVVGHPLYALYMGLHPELQAHVSSANLLGGWYFPGLFTIPLHAVLLPRVIHKLRHHFQDMR